MPFHSKYIIADLENKKQIAFVFCESLQHDEAARMIGGKIVSAGFCQIIENQYYCYGGSISLDCKSRYNIDSDFLNNMLGTNS